MYHMAPEEKDAYTQSCIAAFGLKFPRSVQQDSTGRWSYVGKKTWVRPKAGRKIAVDTEGLSGRQLQRRVNSQASHAFRLAKAGRPDTGACEACSSTEGTRQAHHAPLSMSQLKAAGQHAEKAAHVFVWLCEGCHLAAHKGQPIERLMQKAARL